MAENYSDGLLDDFEGVEDFEGSIEELEQLDDVNSAQPSEEVQETQETQDGEVNYNDLSTEELEKLLEESNEETVEETNSTENKTDEVHTNLKIALSESREKSNLLKEQNELAKQQIELLKQELGSLKVNNETPEQITEQLISNEQVNTVLDDIDDESVISGAELKKVLELQKQQNQQFQNQQNQQTIQNRVIQLEKDFAVNHGDELGDMSYKNIYNLYKTDPSILTKGQELDIQNALTEGKNPVEVFYNTIISSTPKLKEKQFIKRLIEQRKSTPQSTEPVVQQDNVADEDFASKGSSSDMKSHLDKLSDF